MTNVRADRADPPLGGTVSLIRSLVPSLVPSEQRVAKECVDHPEAVAMLSVADLAARTETSSATVIRTSQNLGFKGFQHLRLLLLRDLGSARTEPSAASNDPQSAGWVPAMFETTARELPRSLGALDYAEFDGAAAAIATAKRVLIVANGGSGPAAQMLALRLLTTGRPCEAPYDAVTQQLSARLIGPDDVCIAISQTGLNGVTLRAVEAASGTGATIVGITGYAKSRLHELSTFTIVGGASLSAWGDDSIIANAVQLMLVSALHSAVMRSIGGPGEAAAAVLDEVMTIVNGEVPGL